MLFLVLVHFVDLPSQDIGSFFLTILLAFVHTLNHQRLCLALEMHFPVQHECKSIGPPARRLCNQAVQVFANLALMQQVVVTPHDLCGLRHISEQLLVLLASHPAKVPLYKTSNC